MTFPAPRMAYGRLDWRLCRTNHDLLATKTSTNSRLSGRADHVALNSAAV